MKVTLMGNTLHPIRKNGLITGYAMASEELTRAYLQYSSAEKLICLYEPGQYQKEHIEDILETMHCTARTEFVSEYDLLFHGVETMPETDILHSVKEDAIPMLYLRETMKRPVPITFIMHGLAEQHLMLDYFYLMLTLPFRPYDALLCSSQAVYDTAEAILHRLQEICHTPKQQIRLEKLPLGVDTDYFRPLDQKQCRQICGIPEDAFVILWLGRFSDMFKADLHPLLHVFERLVRQNPHRKLLLMLVGSEDADSVYSSVLCKDIEHMGITGNTRILFHHEIPDRASLYAACDVFTSPIDNIQETFGLTPVEAMACGVPQVVSDWDGYRDTVEDGVTGFRIKTAWCDCLEDIASADFLPLNIYHRRLLQRSLMVRSVVVDCQEYYKKLQTLLNDPVLLKSMQLNSRKRALEKFSLEVTVKNTEEIWERLMKIAANVQSDFHTNAVPMLDYCHDFKAYPVVILDKDTLFEITEYGSSAHFSDLPQYEVFMHVVEEAELPEKILNYAIRKKRFGIANIMSEFNGYSVAQIKRSVMFLYKYDMITPMKNKSQF